MRTIKRISIAGVMLGAVLSASAHPGHGLPGAAHWHTSDGLAFVAAALAAVGLILWGRRK